MNFEFSAEQRQLRNETRRFLEQRCPSAAVRAVLDGVAPYDSALWSGFAEMGFLAANIPEAYGGLGLGYLELCVLAEEVGRALAPVPFSSSVYLATEFLLTAGTDAQRARWLPRLARGEAIGTLALAESAGRVTPTTISTRADRGVLSGTKIPVPDGDVADFAIVAARIENAVGLFLVDLTQGDVQRATVDTIDPTRNHTRLTFSQAFAEPLGSVTEGWSIIENVLDKAAVLTAFEQLGGADKTLGMARDYALERVAFGRPIGSFQAIKHMLADMYAATILARSNCYYGAWTLVTGGPELPKGAATARVSATLAYQQCAKNNIQVHGGAGFTWAMDCHLYFRRSNLLALSLGGVSEWEDRLIESLLCERSVRKETK